MNARYVALQVLCANEIYCSAERLHAVHLSVFVQSPLKEPINLSLSLLSLTRRHVQEAVVELGSVAPMTCSRNQ